MKKKLILTLTLSILILPLKACSSNKDTVNIESSISINEESNINNTETVTEKDFSKFFGDINGTAVFYNPSNNNFDVHNTNIYDVQAYPCSSFKVVSTLIGLDKGLLQDENTKLGYDGTKYPRAEINKDLTLKEAFNLSAVWYYKKLIDEMSPVDIKKELDYLNYGNKDISQWDGSNINSLPQLN